MVSRACVNVGQLTTRPTMNAIITTTTRRGLCFTATINTKVALVLSGCGVYDGTEIHEASACLVHLSRHGATTEMYAPDVNQMHVINHCKGEPTGETRNVLTESARIARGDIKALSTLKEENFDAVIFPGGFGAAKNVSTFAADGAKCTVNADASKTIKSFYAASKPIGLCCIAPVLAVKCLPGVSVTVGCDVEEAGKWPYAGTAAAINDMGGKHVNTKVQDIHVDEAMKVVTTAAFMCQTAIHEIFDGIGKMVDRVLELTRV